MFNGSDDENLKKMQIISFNILGEEENNDKIAALFCKSDSDFEQSLNQ